ncbi:MAG: nuclear transport factor 2 family protein [Myxococcota bacterium]
MSTTDTLETLIAQQAIRDVLSRYCRGLDRMDRAMADDVFFEDATADYLGIYAGTGHGFIEWVWGSHAAMERHSHQITNVLVELGEDGAHATSEAYVTVVLWTLPDAEGNQLELVGRGRYLDRWEKRGDRWAIVHRVHVLDLSSQFPLSRGEVPPESRRDEQDPSFDYVAKGAR